jgi:hypothetical protein
MATDYWLNGGTVFLAGARDKSPSHFWSHVGSCVTFRTASPRVKRLECVADCSTPSSDCLLIKCTARVFRSDSP